MVDTKAFRSVSYGVYIVTAQAQGAPRGCVINTFAQMTSTPPQASVALNKENATTEAVLAAGMFEVSVLSQDAPMDLIGKFGFQSSVDVDKFAGTQVSVDEAGIPYVTEGALAHFCIKVTQTLDLGSHYYIVGEVVESAVLAKGEPMTYAYYHQVKGGKTPPKASSYEALAPTAEPAFAVEEAPAAEAGKKYGWQCTLCGYVYEMDEMPDDFVCPWCGAGKDMFERIEL